MGQTDSEDRAHRLRVAAALASVLLIAVVAGLALRWASSDRDADESPPQTAITPAQETSAAPLPALPVTPTPPPDATTGAIPATANADAQPGEVGSVGSTSSASPAVRAPRVAFRLASTLYTAGEDGSGPTPVVRVAEGPFALSPDGATLAVVSGDTLTLYDTASGAGISAGAALTREPVWMPDSSAVLFFRETSDSGVPVSEAWRVARDGSGAKKLRRGTGVSVSPDGRVVAVVSSAAAPSGADRGVIHVSRDGGAFRALTVLAGEAVAVAAGNDRVYVAATGPDCRSCAVSMGLDGSGETRILTEPTVGTLATWGSLLLSPDGTRLVAAASGDDRFSRLSIVATTGGSAVNIDQRRDGYLRNWSADSGSIFYIEGNSYQGEPTTLMRVGADGSGRRAVVTGAQ